MQYMNKDDNNINERGIYMLKQSKVDAMNEAVADFVIKRVGVLSPTMVTHDELSTLAELVKAVNGAPIPLTMFDGTIQPL